MISQCKLVSGCSLWMETLICTAQWHVARKPSTKKQQGLARANKLPNTSGAKRLQTTAPSLHAVSIHQMAPPERSDTHPITAYYSFIDLERITFEFVLSLISWLACSGRFTHITGHPSAAGPAQDRESSTAKDRRSTTVLRNQPSHCIYVYQSFTCNHLQYQSV